MFDSPALPSVPHMTRGPPHRHRLLEDSLVALVTSYGLGFVSALVFDRLEHAFT